MRIQKWASEKMTRYSEDVLSSLRGWRERARESCFAREKNLMIQYSETPIKLIHLEIFLISFCIISLNEIL